MSEVALQEDFLGAFGVLEREGSILLAANRRPLRTDAAASRTYDLPGGRVESGERLEEALAREWAEETGLTVEAGRFLMVQEGVRYEHGDRRYAWRSFFFEVRAEGEPRPQSEVEGLLWVPAARLGAVLTAPYHKAFLRWRAGGSAFQFDEWR